METIPNMRGRKRCFCWLAAAAFLAIQTLALAHEIQHDLGRHSDPSCVLHALADHAGKAMPAAVALIKPEPQKPVVTPLCKTHLPCKPAVSFHARAPPFTSKNSIV